MIQGCRARVRLVTEDMTYMLKPLVLAAAVMFATASLSMAQDAPKSADDCFKMSADLFKAADAQKLPDDQRGKVEQMLEKMETHCDAKQFAEAATIAKDVKGVIAAR